MLRILFKKMAFHHCEPMKSAWQSAAQQVSLENKGHRSALADVSLENHRKILESCAICLKAPESSCFLSLRGEAEAIHKNNAESMDCHADKSARNDRKTAPSKKVDSRSNKNAEVLQSSNSQNAARRQDFGDKNGALQGESRAHTRAYVTAGSPQQSPFLAQKPTPKPSQILTYKENK